MCAPVLKGVHHSGVGAGGVTPLTLRLTTENHRYSDPVRTVELSTPNKGHFGDNTISADFSFVKMLYVSFLEVENVLKP